MFQLAQIAIWVALLGAFALVALAWLVFVLEPVHEWLRAHLRIGLGTALGLLVYGLTLAFVGHAWLVQYGWL